MTVWTAPCVGPYPRDGLVGWDQGRGLSDADWEWLAVDATAAALEDMGSDEALSRVCESTPGADIPGADHDRE